MKQHREDRKSLRNLWRDESGAIAVILTVTLPVIVGFMTLAVDASYLFTAQNQLQIAADAAALAAVQDIGSYTSPGTTSTPCTTATTWTFCTAATTMAGASPTYYNEPNAAGTASIITPSTGIVIGQWTGNPAKFVACSKTAPCSTSAFPNAVQVTTQMTSVKMYFTPILVAIAKNLGFSTYSLTATATAAYTSVGAGSGVSGSLSTPANLIIVQDISGSFTSNLGSAQDAAQDCAKYFKLTGGQQSYFGITEFTGNSPQKNWQPNGWTNPTSWTTGKGKSNTNPAPSGWSASVDYTDPYYALTSTTASNCTSSTGTGCWVQYPTIGVNGTSNTINGTATSNTAASGCGGDAATPYFCSGSNISAGMQSAINQFCPTANACGENVQNLGTTEMIVITDGVPNCTQMGSGDPYGGSSMITSPNDQSCDGQTGSSGNSNLMNNAWDLATLAGQNGISVSVIYYSGDGSCSPANTCVSELEELEGNSKTQLNLYHPGSVQPQFFSEPTAANLASDMLQICAAGLSKPRLVL